jgi:hypothetical protein
MFHKSIVAIAIFCAAGELCAEPPKQGSAFGFVLGATPASLETLLGRQYPNCEVRRSIYHEVPGDVGPVLAGLTINVGMLDTCAGSPAGSDITDYVDVRFVHPSIDRSQPLYQAEVERAYPDILYSPERRIRYAFERLRAELFRTYGRPTDERREEAVSASASLAASLGVGKGVKRQDYLVRYLWSSKGRLPDVEYEGSVCDCGARYAKATIEITRAPTTIPKNEYYVTHITLLVEDNVLGDRQREWDAQWMKK